MTSVQRSPEIDVRRAGSRFFTDAGWLDSKHSFAFGHHRSRTNTHHGLLLVNNDDRVAPGTGFDTHPHRDMEIVTWVLDGSLVHQDSMGNNGVIYPGLAQRMSAGTGILHSERNDSWNVAGGVHETPVHFVQMWVLPDEQGISPRLRTARDRAGAPGRRAGHRRLGHPGPRRRHGHPDRQPRRGAACRPVWTGPGGGAARRAVPPPLRPPGIGRTRGRRPTRRGRRRPADGNGRATGHRRVRRRGPGVGDARRGGVSAPPPVGRGGRGACDGWISPPRTG